MRKFELSVLLLVVIVIPSAALSLTLGGRFTTSLYSWERQDTDTTSSDHLRAYQSAILNVGRIGAQNLSLHTYLQATSDLGRKAKDDPRYKIYNTYFKWRKIAGAVDVSLGRQRIYAGVGYGTVDGAKLEWNHKDLFRVSGYVGVLAPLGKSNSIDSWSDSHIWGFHLTTHKIYKAAIGVSFVRKNRLPLKYKRPGRYSQWVIRNISLQQQLLGLDVRRSLGEKLNLYGRLDFDTLSQRVRGTEFIARYSATKNLRLTGEFIHRSPTINYNSIFSVFDLRNNWEIALRGHYMISKLVHLSANFATVIYDDDTSQRIGFGASLGQSYLGYNRRIGYGGESDGFSGSLRYPINSKFWLKADANFLKYRLHEGVDESDEIVTVTLGFNYRPERHVSLDFEGQNLRNKIYSSDLRFFFRANVWLFAKS